MVQHVLLIRVAAPLLAVSAPLGTLLLGLPPPLAVTTGHQWKAATRLQTVWRWASHPAAAWALHSLALWVWHAPVFYKAALASEWLHMSEHITLLGMAWLFWWVCVHPTRRSAWLHGPGGAHCSSKSALITRAKKYIAEPRFRIALPDLVMGEVQQLRSRLGTDDFTSHANDTSNFAQLLKGYEAAVLNLQLVMALTSYWGQSEHTLLISKALSHLIEAEATRGTREPP